MNRSSRESQKGFTLIELLVVLALMGLMTGLMAGGFELVAGGWKRIGTRESGRGSLQATEELLRTLLSSAVPLPRSLDRNDPRIAFEGLRDRLEFRAELQARFGAKDVAIYDLTANKEGGLRLAIRLDRDDSDNARSTYFPETELPTGGLNVEFSYFGVDSPDEAEAWHSYWERVKKIPTLVRVHWIRGNETGSIPDLIVAPLAATRDSCSVDKARTECPD